MSVAPHAAAANTGATVLREGGNAVEAMLAMAATIAVAYPHMNGIGGDGFWLLSRPGEDPIGIQACGPAARAATPDQYRRFAKDGAIPARGGPAALTVAGTVAGWIEAARVAHDWGGRLPMDLLVADAISIAKTGVKASRSQSRLTAQKLGELADVPGFAETFLLKGRPPETGDSLAYETLADTLAHLARAGFEDFYRGDVARALARDLEAAGSPLRLEDLQGYKASRVAALSVPLGGVRVFNLPPPTQGIASLMILAIADRLGHPQAEGFQRVHDLVEATKQAFRVRDAHVCDPAGMTVDPRALLSDSEIGKLARGIDRTRAAPWPHVSSPGDTIWMGAIDGEGKAASFIQSLYWEFGSGVVSPSTGILWQNRGVSFSLDPIHPNCLAPGKLPFHTLNPAMALFDDGRTMVYGTMGGDGQPQTQAAIFSRYVWGGMSPEAAIDAPRWLLGRTWGSANTNLKLERGFAPPLVDALAAAGHELEILDERHSDMMGHAGMIVRHRDGRILGASDPRCDGEAVRTLR
jgi:gamma-glutamyltranspeptidase/glutathione hydrolase